MNKRLVQTKKKQLILIALVTTILLAGSWYGLINPQLAHRQQVRADREKLIQELNREKTDMRKASSIEEEFMTVSNKLAEAEVRMITGDSYAWLVNCIQSFSRNYRLSIAQITQPQEPKVMELIPKFPYKQVTVTLGGEGQFQQIGRFLADFENEYPFARVVGIDIEPSSAPREPNDLQFRLDVSMLVKQ